MKTYALIGAAGYIAPRHMKAIKETEGLLVAACDKSDSVGILDSYFPDCEFFVEPERFERHLSKHPVDYLVVCTPNYLHDVHIRMGWNVGADVICEKPLVVNPWNLDALEKIGKSVYVIQQLRLHPARQKLKIPAKRQFTKVKVTYHAPRGKWYDISWKGDESKSGGLLYNIGVHIFDLMGVLYGGHYKTDIISSVGKHITGRTWYEKAEVCWNLSTDVKKPCKEITVNGETVSINNGFEELHTKSYERILDGKGYDISCVRSTIETLHKIRSML